MAFPTPPIDGPPPSPATNPAAAQEVGQPRPIGGLASPVQMQPSGPDLSGVLTLGEKIEQALITLAQAAPLIAPDMDQAKAILMNALGRFAAESGGTGTSGSMPMAAQGSVVTQSGSQFPGSQSGGRPF